MTTDTLDDLQGDLKEFYADGHIPEQKGPTVAAMRKMSLTGAPLGKAEWNATRAALESALTRHMSKAPACTSCLYYAADKRCDKFGEKPPVDFLPIGCNEWTWDESAPF